MRGLRAVAWSSLIFVLLAVSGVARAQIGDDGPPEFPPFLNDQPVENPSEWVPTDDVFGAPGNDFFCPILLLAPRSSILSSQSFFCDYTLVKLMEQNGSMPGSPGDTPFSCTNGSGSGFGFTGEFYTNIYGTGPDASRRQAMDNFALGSNASDYQTVQNSINTDYVGNPVNVTTGNKYQAEVDFQGPGMLEMVRHYNSTLRSWTHSYLMRVASNGRVTAVLRPDGKIYRYTGHGPGSWTPGDNSINARLTQLVAIGPNDPTWRLVTEKDTVELYDRHGLPLSITARGGTSLHLAYSGGLLRAVTDDWGRSLTFAYDGANRLVSHTSPGGRVTQLGYDSMRRLSTVTYPDFTSRAYVYEDPARPFHLTGIIDENGSRFATFAYGAKGKAISTEHALGTLHYQLQYHDNQSVSVTDPLGTQRVVRIASTGRGPVWAGQDQPYVGKTAFKQYNHATSLVTQATDFLGGSLQLGLRPRSQAADIVQPGGRPSRTNRRQRPMASPASRSDID